MTIPRDAYWDELGVAWCATNPDLEVMTRQLQARLHRQSLLITAGVIAGIPLCVAGLVLGVYTIWLGWAGGVWNFIARGIAIEVISALLAMAVWLQLQVRTSAAASTVSAMLDLAIARARRMLATLRLGFYACVVAAILGLVGTVIRSSLGVPPQQSPIIDLVLLALCALTLFGYGRHQRETLARLLVLKHSLGVDGGV